ncbi:hybrid sensor histidine kinase/response regulator [Vibrio ulleungensis]|uniref:histidine kinase n=1 Tax=Vibrio ulleungensis TaxID=2807619 RepID=A0ABS2HD95_9VIBR|nr:transporter substrate-binding domain-containing protein [Vibrio ulleungensis]MBM7035565.1 transporter substrate-binding domain-containing protein [Vibrio ulleungensis]
MAASNAAADPHQDVNYKFAVITEETLRQEKVLTTFYGINSDYLHNISKALGFTFELIAYDDIESVFSAIDNGDVDAALGFSATPKREQRFLFSEPLFEATTAMWFSDPHMALFPMSRISWACVANSVHCDHVAKSNPRSIVTYDNFQSAMQGILKGEAHGIIGNFISITEYLDRHDIHFGTMTLPSHIKPEKLRLITSKHNQQIVDQFNQVLNWEAQGTNVRSIASRNRYHVADRLLTKFRHGNGSSNQITYSTSSNAYPFFYTNNKGDHDGFLVDFMSILTSRSGLAFEYRSPARSKGDLAGFTADLVPVAYASEPIGGDWALTKPFITTNYVSVDVNSLVPSTSTGKYGVLISVDKQGIVHLDSWRDNAMLRFTDLSQMLSALKHGEIDVGYLPEDIAHNYLANSAYSDFQLATHSSLPISIAFAVSSTKPELTSLINAFIDTLDQDEVIKLHQSYRKFTIKQGHSTRQIAIVTAALMALFIVVMVFVYVGRKNLKLKVTLAHAVINQEEKEKHWLQEIIGQLNSLVFIHDDNNDIVLTNCSRMKSGACTRCTLRDVNDKTQLVDNSVELKLVMKDQLIAQEHEVERCHLNIQHVTRERKIIQSSVTSKPYVITVMNDLTAQKRREESLAKAQAEAMSAVTVREQFLATMSHELRTPIAGVHGLLDLLGHKLSDPSLVELIEQAKSSTSLLNQLVNEVLDFSKIDSGDTTLIITKVDLVAVLCESVRAFEQRANNKGLPIQFAFLPTLHRFAMTDSTRLVQIVSNLLSNAIKFTHNGSVQVDIKLTHTELDLKVTDTGIGMTKEQLSNVLKPFVQADSTISREYGGTGLGLTIVDKIVTSMDGQIMIESIPDVGTTVRVTLPLTLELQPMPKWNDSVVFDSIAHSNKAWCDIWNVPLLPSTSLAEKDIQNEKRLDLSGLESKYPDLLFKKLSEGQKESASTTLAQHRPLNGHVLVAEDNPLNQALLKMQLSQLGLNYTVTNNGLEAIKQLKSNSRFDIVITDFHMPKMDGIALANFLQDSTQSTSLPIIAITADDPHVAAKKATQSGIHKVITKPYSLDDLRHALQPLLKPTSAIPFWLDQFASEERIEIAQLFVDTVTKDIELIESSFDHQITHQALHSLKGGLAALSITNYGQLFKKLDSSNSTERKDHIAELIQSLRYEIAHTTTWISHHE